LPDQNLCRQIVQDGGQLELPVLDLGDTRADLDLGVGVRVLLTRSPWLTNLRFGVATPISPEPALPTRRGAGGIPITGKGIERAPDRLKSEEAIGCRNDGTTGFESRRLHVSIHPFAKKAPGELTAISGTTV
jgi:hypothetical protein